MANRIDAVLAGHAEVGTVISAWADNSSFQGADKSTFKSELECLAKLVSRPLTRTAALAVVASCLNQRVTDTHCIWNECDERGLRYVYLDSDDTAKLFASLLCD